MGELRGIWFGVSAGLLMLALPTGMAASTGDDWPQWRGPSRDGSATGFEPPAEWPDELALVWEAEVGAGDSAPVIADGRLVTVTRGDQVEVVAARDLATGEVIWRVELEAPFSPLAVTKEHGAGPFSTPTVADGRLVTISIHGVVTALSVADGRTLWSNQPGDRFKRSSPFYGASQAPLIDDGRVFVHVGGPGDGAFLALDAATGRELWSWTGDGPAYGAPIRTRFGGRDQIVTLTQRHLVGLDPATGELLWQERFQLNFDVTALTPTVVGETIVLSGYRVPTRAYRLAGNDGAWKLEQVWANEDVFTEYTSPVVAGGALFFYSFQKKGNLLTLDPSDGSVTWEAGGRLGETANLVTVGDDLVLLVTSDGELKVFQVAADGARELASYEVAESAVWAHPAVADQKIVIKDAVSVRVFEVRPD